MRHAHLPNSSFEVNLCISHLHVQDFNTARFMLYAEVLKKGLDSVHRILEQLRWLEMFTTGLHPDADVKICFVDKEMLLISLFILITALSIFMTFLFLPQRLLKIKCHFNQMSLTPTPALAGCPVLDALFTQCMEMLPSLYLCLLLFLLHCHLLETIMFSSHLQCLSLSSGLIFNPEYS